MDEDINSFLGTNPPETPSSGDSAAFQWKVASDLHYQRNDPVAAEAAYRVLIREHPESQEAEWAREQLEILGVKAEPQSSGAAMPKGGFEFIRMMKGRYWDAYKEAHAVIVIGKIVKGVAIFVFAAGILLGIELLTDHKHPRDNNRSDPVEEIFGLALLIVGIVVGLALFILGILVKSSGQMQLAELDTAVNSSRHLTDDDVKEILSKSLLK
jgi:hypothetical protein